LGENKNFVENLKASEKIRSWENMKFVEKKIGNYGKNENFCLTKKNRES